MKHFTIIHFSQDFARGKAQLGGFGRILNICSDKNRHIIFTLSARITNTEVYNIDSIKVIEIPIDKMPVSKKRQIFIYKKIATKIHEYLATNKINPDLLFGHSQLFNFFILRELQSKFFPNLKILWEANAIWGIHHSGNLKVRINNRLNWILQRRIFRQADGIICQTNASKDFIIRNFGVEVDRCGVVTNAVLSVTNQIRDCEKNEPRRVLCLGLFDEMNGIPFLADFIRNERKVNGIEFHFIGDGLYKPIVEKLNSDGLCTYWGRLSHNEMQKRYSEFDFVIIPRLPCVEADLFIPTKLLESMAAGVIPICSDVKGMTEVIIDEKNGFSFKAGNITDLQNTLYKIKEYNNEQLKKVAFNARTTVSETYNWNNNHNDLALIYSELIKN